MKNIEIKPNLFDLSEEEQEASKMIYDGKIIKCLVAPYHSYAELEKIVPFTKNTFLFPEREVPASKLNQIVAMCVKNPSQEEFRIITTNQIIIIDMIDSCVRVLTEDGSVIPSPVKTFMANIHDIRYSLLENELHRTSKEVKPINNTKLNKLLAELKDPKPVTQKKYDELKKQVEQIGEEVVRSIFENHLEDKTIKK